MFCRATLEGGFIRELITNLHRKNKRRLVMNEKGESDFGAIAGLAIIAWLASSWITHVIVCLKAGSWGFLIAGAIMFPIAVIHGTGSWFGFW